MAGSAAYPAHVAQDERIIDMSDKPSIGNTAKANVLALKTCFGFGGAWLHWQMAVPGFEAFVLFAAIWALGGVICAGQLAWLLIQLTLQAGKFGRFKGQGVDPKADPMPSEDDLRAKGLTK